MAYGYVNGTTVRVVNYEKTSAIDGLIAAADMNAGDLVGLRSDTGKVDLASVSNALASLKVCIGVLTQDVLAGNVCSIATIGTITGLKAADMSGIYAGAKLYLGATAGKYGVAAPTTDTHALQAIGFALDGTSVGTIVATKMRFMIIPSPVLSKSSTAAGPA